MNVESNVAAKLQPHHTTVRMTKSMASAFIAAYKGAYGTRGGCRWLEEALTELLKSKDYLFLVGAGEANLTFEITRGITLTPKCKALLEEGVIRFRKVDNLANGVAAKVLRAAIRHRLERESENTDRSKRPAGVEIKVGRLLKKAASTN